MQGMKSRAPGFSAKQQGYVLIIVLIVITVLTVMGTVAIDTTVVDMEIARSHKELRESFYLAEAAAMEGVQLLLNTSAHNRAEAFLFWHHGLRAVEKDNLEFKDFTIWRTDVSDKANALQSKLDPEAFIAAVEDRVAGGSSLIATGSRLYINRLYGRCTKYNTDTLVQVGYYMRY